MAFIVLKNLKKQFGNQEILRGVNLEITPGTMTVIVGKSGQGKSVLLKHIVGLIKPDEGNIFVNEVDIIPLSSAQQASYLKMFGYVFQFAALLDSLTVYENMALAVMNQSLTETEKLKRITEKLDLVHLTTAILHKYPSDISGGMRKRVGLARTLLTNPSVILYDEPTTGLDPITSRAIHELMYDMQKQLHITSIVISHDISIFEYATSVAFLHEGIIQWYGSAVQATQCDNPYMHQFTHGLIEGPIQHDIS